MKKQKIDMNGIYEISLYGFPAQILVKDYLPAESARASGPPGDCYPGINSDFDWQAETGNELLNHYIDTDLQEHKNIREQLVEAIHIAQKKLLEDKAAAQADQIKDQEYD